MMKGKLLKTLAVIATSVMAVVVMPTAVKAGECEHTNTKWGRDWNEEAKAVVHSKYCTDCGKKFVDGEYHKGKYDGAYCEICGFHLNVEELTEGVGTCECSGNGEWMTTGLLDEGFEIHSLVCLTCKKPKNSHIAEYYKDRYVSYYAGHRRLCKHCSQGGEYIPHEYDSNMTCTVCGYVPPRVDESCNSSDTSKSEEKQEESKPRDLNKEAFGGREASQLSVTEQKSAVSYAIDSLRASGNALAANVVTSNNGGNGKASDIAAVVADNRDAANQQIFAQVACANLGFKNVTPLATYNMYSLHSSYTAKNGAQVITWANTGLKAGDTAFVVWYNQKLGKIELLPALVDANGNVLVNVPALGDVSTMTVVKASK